MPDLRRRYLKVKSENEESRTRANNLHDQPYDSVSHNAARVLAVLTGHTAVASPEGKRVTLLGTAEEDRAAS